MRILLPPSETKRPGGAGAPWEATSGAFGSLADIRERVVDALVDVSAGPVEAAVKALKITARQTPELSTNVLLRHAPTMPAVDRYTGVLYDALDASSLGGSGRRWLGEHVVIQTAPFGPVGALEPLPAYRMAAAARLPALGNLARVWADPSSAALATDDLVLDMRSEAYAALGPVRGERCRFVRVVEARPDGTTRALNHFNKQTKGLFVRLLAAERPRLSSVAGLVRFAAQHGYRMDDADRELLLFAPA